MRKSSPPAAVASVLLFSGILLAGCRSASSHSDDPNAVSHSNSRQELNEPSVHAGGDGPFGEDPQQPGAYGR